MVGEEVIREERQEETDFARVVIRSRIAGSDAQHNQRCPSSMLVTDPHQKRSSITRATAHPESLDGEMDHEKESKYNID